MECKFCSEDNDNIIITSAGQGEREYIGIQIETGGWDSYNDCEDKVYLWGIKFCPYCGRNLTI